MSKKEQGIDDIVRSVIVTTDDTFSTYIKLTKEDIHKVVLRKDKLKDHYLLLAVLPTRRFYKKLSLIRELIRNE